MAFKYVMTVHGLSLNSLSRLFCREKLLKFEEFQLTHFFLAWTMPLVPYLGIVCFCFFFPESLTVLLLIFNPTHFELIFI